MAVQERLAEVDLSMARRAMCGVIRRSRKASTKAATL